MTMLSYDPDGAFRDGQEITVLQYMELSPQLEEIKEQLVQAYQAALAVNVSSPEAVGFHELPEQLLLEKSEAGEASIVGHIEQLAGQLRNKVDSVVLLGAGGSSAGARSLMDACSHPFHNERGDLPRFYFAGGSIDNDATSALFDVLTAQQRPFVVLVISKSGSTLETAIALRQFVALDRKLRRPDWPGIDELLIPVTTPGSRLDKIADELACRHRFYVPENIGGRFSVLSPVGLLPAALLGIDVVALLEGAATMNRRFETSLTGDNPVLDYAGVGHLAETVGGRTIRVLATWDESLRSTGLWYDQLLAESLGKEQRGSTPLTTLNTRDLHSRAQQHQQGRPDKLITNLVVSRSRAEPLGIGTASWNHDQLGNLEQQHLTDVQRAAREATDEALHSVGCPTAQIELPDLDPFSLGQFYQMMMLATVVEGKLLGVNPFGQPGVEAYKKNMARILGLDAD